jgi:hypothetical protein
MSCQVYSVSRSFTTYSAVDRVLYVVHPVLPRACDQHELVRMLVQPLLYPRIVAALLRLLSIRVLVMFLVVDIAHIALGDILGRLLCGGRCLGRRSRGTVRYLIWSAHGAGGYCVQHVEVLRAAGEANPGPSELVESWRAKDPYGLLSSSSHMSPTTAASRMRVSFGGSYRKVSASKLYQVLASWFCLGDVEALGSRGSHGDVDCMGLCGAHIARLSATAPTCISRLHDRTGVQHHVAELALETCMLLFVFLRQE